MAELVILSKDEQKATFILGEVKEATKEQLLKEIDQLKLSYKEAESFMKINEVEFAKNIDLADKTYEARCEQYQAMHDDSITAIDKQLELDERAAKEAYEQAVALARSRHEANLAEEEVKLENNLQQALEEKEADVDTQNVSIQRARDYLEELSTKIKTSEALLKQIELAEDEVKKKAEEERLKKLAVETAIAQGGNIQQPVVVANKPKIGIKF